jgi:hypothetical protein
MNGPGWRSTDGFCLAAELLDGLAQFPELFEHGLDVGFVSGG